MRKRRKTRLFALLLSLAMLLGSVPVLAAEKPDKAENPSWGDVWDLISYVLDFTESDDCMAADFDDEEEMYYQLTHWNPEGTIFFNEKLHDEWLDMAGEFYWGDNCTPGEYWDLEGDDRYSLLLTGDALTNYSKFYDDGVEIINTRRIATGECYYDDIRETMLTLERQYAAFWEKIGNEEIIVIGDDEEPLEEQEWIYYSDLAPLEEESSNIYSNYWPQTDEAWESITRAEVQNLITLFTTALNNVKNAQASGNFSGDFTPETPSDTPETSGGTPQVSGNSVTAATGASTVAAAVEAIASTSSVKGVKSTVSGAYLIKKVDGVAFTTPLADIVAGYGVASSEKVYAMVWDLNPEKSYLAQAVIDNTAAALGAEVGPALNIELGKKDAAGKYTLLSQDGPAVTIMVGVPANFVEEGKTLAVVRVRPGGAVSILADLDADADTVTFTTTAGAGAYAIVKY